MVGRCSVTEAVAERAGSGTGNGGPGRARVVAVRMTEASGGDGEVAGVHAGRRRR